MKQYDTWLFDWDGTLANSGDIWLEVLNESFAKHGLKPSRQQIKAALGEWQFDGLGIPINDIQTFKADIRATAIQRMCEAPLFPGAADVLAHLKDRRKKNRNRDSHGW